MGSCCCFVLVLGLAVLGMFRVMLCGEDSQGLRVQVVVLRGFGVRVVQE